MIIYFNTFVFIITRISVNFEVVAAEVSTSIIRTSHG